MVRRGVSVKSPQLELMPYYRPISAGSNSQPGRFATAAPENALSQLTLAAEVQSSQSRVAKMEAGDPSVSLDLLIRSLLSLGASERDRSQIITISRAA